MSHNTNTNASTNANAKTNNPPVDPAGPPSGGTTNPSHAGANTCQPVGWNDPTAGPYQCYGGMDWPNLSHPHAPHAMPQYPPPGYLTQYALNPYPPTSGPNDAPHGPYHPPPPIAGPSRQPAIDPALLPLPEDDNDDFPPAHKLLPKIAKPASKVAGSRCPAPSKGKGKQKADTPATVSKWKAAGHADNELAAKHVKRGGRIAGAVNYNDDDIDQLLDLLEDHLPTGGYGWNTVGAAYNEWANSCGRPERTVKSLELKYKQYVHATKPTGDAECPPYVEHSHYIESLINSRAETSGSEDEDEDHETDKEDADPPRKDSTNTQRQRATKSKIKKDTEERGPMARRPPADKILQPRARNSSRNDAQQLLSSISTALDPATQAARDEDRASRSLHTTQLLTMGQQLRDAHATIESLCTQLQQAERARYEAERQADHIELMSLFRCSNNNADRDRHPYQAATRQFTQHELESPSASRRRREHHLLRTPHRTSRRSPHFSNRRDTPRYTSPSHRVRLETLYPDGGRHVTWAGGSDDDDPTDPLTTLYRNTSPAVRFTIDNTPTRAPRAPPSDEEGLPRDDTNTDA
ncbi:unnamed protein product [Cyclocybe aegerita]|uniref:DUF6818 domain-containing protein n=1 Tax=Cyclocybe aegerita TaxID=1973307 RepID=A0A8S0W152_CYCAE|nr:unnamed protein product [Cyclocybe aegerita]